MKYVYIVDKHCKPLMPTTRFGHVRKLLKEKKAVPICNSPFTIKLKYDVPGYTQPVYEGIDTGRENIGDAASLENGENVFLADVRTNNKSIKKKMQDRAGFRRERRRHDRQSKQRKAKQDGTEIKNGYGNVVVIDHGFGYKTRYAHLQEMKVIAAQVVIRGDIIGTLGSSGLSTGPHLHYEVLYRGEHVNPWNFLNPDVSPEEYNKMMRNG